MRKKIKYYILSSFSALILLSAPSLSQTLQEGIDLYNSGDYDKAIWILKKIAESEPENPEPHKWLSKCYESTLQLEKTFSENKIYSSLKEKLEKKKNEPKVVSPTPVPERKKKSWDTTDSSNEEELKTVDPMDRKLALLDENFLKGVVDARQPSTIENKKPLEFDEIKPLILNVPVDKNELLKFNKKLEIKKIRNIASHQDEIMFKKSDAELILYEINEYKEKYQNEANSDKKNFYRIHLGNLIDKYEKRVYELTNLINKAVYTYTDVLSFEYFSHLSVPKDIYLSDMEKKKKELDEFFKEADENITNYNSELASKEKDFGSLTNQVNTDLLNKDPSFLSPTEKDMVDSYRSLENLIKEIKENIFSYQMEKEVLTEAIHELSSTVEKVKGGGSEYK